MNRTLVCGIALFFAIVGLSLVGSEKSASAGLFRHHGCGGCDCSGAPNCGGNDCGGADCGGCHGRKRCHGLFHKCHGRQHCHGRKHCHGLFHKKRCCGCAGEVVAPACCTEVTVEPSCAGTEVVDEAPEAPAAPEAEAPAAPEAAPEA